MKITFNRLVSVGDEATPIQLFESLTGPVSDRGPNFTKVHSSLGSAEPMTYGALDDDLVSICHVGGSAAVVRTPKTTPWGSDVEQTIEPGATVSRRELRNPANYFLLVYRRRERVGYYGREKTE